MLYAFEDIKTGEQEDFVFPVEEAPKIGEEIIVGGRMYRRIPSFLVDAGVERKCQQYPYVSNRLPSTTKGVKLGREKKGGRMKPVIQSQRHEREVMAKNDLQRDGEGV